MRQTKIKQKVNVIDGNQLVGQVIEEKDPLLATCIDKIDDLPDSMDIDRVMKLKAQIDAGEYSFDDKLDKVVDAMVSESQDDHPISYPLFDRWFSSF